MAIENHPRNVLRMAVVRRLAVPRIELRWVADFLPAESVATCARVMSPKHAEQNSARGMQRAKTIFLMEPPSDRLVRRLGKRDGVCACP